jgi:hypothetical protein
MPSCNSPPDALLCAAPASRCAQELGLQPGRDCAVGDTGITLDLGLYLNGAKASAHARCSYPLLPSAAGVQESSA